MTVAYLRVSTEDQDLLKFHDSVNAYAGYKNLGEVTYIEEKVSGKKVHWSNRAIAGILNDAAVDNLIVPELSRLARSTKQLLEIMEYAEKKEITIHLVKEALIIGKDKSAFSTMFITILSALAQMEADLISERTKEALQARKRKGIKLGRKKGAIVARKLDPYKEEVKGFLAINKSKTWIAEKYGVSRGTLYSFIDANNLWP